jgi:hypothetical protein
MLIAINFSARVQQFAIHSLWKTGEMLISTDPDRALGSFNPAEVVLGPDEAVVVRID